MDSYLSIFRNWSRSLAVYNDFNSFSRWSCHIGWKSTTSNQKRAKGEKNRNLRRGYPLFFEVVFATKLGHEAKSEEEVIDFFQRIIPKLVLWSSDDVLETFIKFRQLSAQPGNTSTFSLFGKMLLDIRKDLGHQNKGLSELYLLGVFVNDIENLSQ